jgi:hypothetical protein
MNMPTDGRYTKCQHLEAHHINLMSGGIELRLQTSNQIEECRLLGFKNPVRTSQETPYVSTTESSQLMLCKM